MGGHSEDYTLLDYSATAPAFEYLSNNFEEHPNGVKFATSLTLPAEQLKLDAAPVEVATHLLCNHHAHPLTRELSLMADGSIRTNAASDRIASIRHHQLIRENSADLQPTVNSEPVNEYCDLRLGDTIEIPGQPTLLLIKVAES